MNGKSFILVTRTMDGKSESFTPGKNSAKKIAVKPGALYLLKNAADNFAPENITLKRVGKDLQVFNEGDEQPGLILTDYFAEVEGSERAPVLLGMAEDGQLYQYIPLSGEGYETGYLMADGQMSPIALGGQPMGAGEAFFTAQEDNSELWPILLGLFALAGAVGGGIAIANHNRDKNDSREPQDTTPPTSKGVGGALDNTGSKTGPLTSGDTTDETRPQLSGKGEPGSTITIYDNGKAIGSTTVDSNGNWLWTPDKPLTEGNHKLTTTETDTKGNTSDPSAGFEINVDTTAPEGATTPPVTTDNVGDKQGPLTGGEATDDAQPELSGKGEPGNTIDIWDNGEKIGSTTVDENGNWSWKPEEPLEEGEHNLSTTETDKAGNTSEPSPDINIIVDTTPPTGATTPPSTTDNVGDKQGPLTDGDYTDDTQPELSGKGEPGNTIDIWDNGEKIGTTTVDENGNWSWTPEEPLGEGEHKLSTTETDKAGNTSEPSPDITINVDTTPPETPSTPGATDNVGEKTGPITSGEATDDAQPELNGKGEPGNTIDIWDNGEKIGSTTVDEKGNWSWKPEEPLPDGEHNVSTTETDKAGNTSEPSPDINIIVDTIPPDADALSITGVNDTVGEITGNIDNGGKTDDSRPTISGTGTAGDTIILYTTDASGKHEIGRTTVDASGNWSIQPQSPLLAGKNVFSAKEIDPAGNDITSDDYSVTLYVVGPNVPSIGAIVDNAGLQTGPLQKGDVTDDNMPTITGSAGAGDTVRIYDNDKLVGSTIADKDGNWSFTPGTALADGEHNITVTATDSVGQTSAKSGEFGFNIDTQAPETVKDLVATDNEGEVQGPIENGGTTDDTTPTLGGSAEPGSTVNIYDGDEKIGEVEVGEDGKWSWTPDEALDDGSHSITVTVTDPAGNESGHSDELVINVDSTDPTAQITSVVDSVGDVVGNITPNGVTDDTRPQINGIAKANSVIKVYDGETLLGSTTSDANGNWSFQPETELAEGSHSLTVTATDLAGSTSQQSGAFVFEVDITSPILPTIDGAIDDVGSVRDALVNGDMTDDSTPTLHGSAEAGSVVTIYDGETVLGSVKADGNGEWQFTPTTPLSEGEHRFTVTATDTAGNESDKSDEFVLSTDYSAPDASKLAITGFEDNVGEVQGNILNGGSTDDTMPVITGTGTAGDTISVYTTVNGVKTLLGSTTVEADGTWKLALDESNALAGGVNQLTAVETDPVGNSTSPTPSYVVTVYTAGDGPSTPSINTVFDDAGSLTGPLQKGSVTDDNTPTLKGNGEAGSTIRIYDNGTLIGSTTVGSDGSWTFTPGKALNDGKHVFKADAVNNVGQVSEESGEWAISIDTAAPNPVEDLKVIDNVGNVQGEIKDGDTTDDSSPTFEGSAEPGSTVNIYDGDEKIGEVEVGEDGKWSWTPDESLGEGDHNLSVSVTDEAGNESDRTPGVNITVDTSEVTIAITSVVDDVGTVTGNIARGGVTDDTTPTINGIGKAGSIVKVYDGETLLGSTTIDANGKWSFTPSVPIAPGEHTITANATDAAGQTSEDVSFGFTIDTTAPTMPTIDSAHDDVGAIQGDLASGGVTDDPTPTLSGTAEAGSLVTIYDGEKAIGSVKADADGKWEFTPTSTLSEGSHTFTVTATDAAGNESGRSNAFTLTTDYSAPDASKLAITGFEDNVGEVQGNILNGGSTDDTMPVITGTGTAGDTISVYTTVNGVKTLLGSTTVEADGTWKLALDESNALSGGVNQITAVETDQAGNSTSPTPAYVVTVYTAGDGPSTPSINTVFDDAGSLTGPLQKGSVTDDNTPTLKGNGEAASIIRIYDNNKIIGSTVVDSDGSWTFTPSTALKDGTHAFRADSVNSVGQASEKSGEWSIEIDTQAPDAITDLVITDNVGDVQGEIKDGDTTDDATPTISGSAEPGSTVNIYDGERVIDTVEVGEDGKWSWTPDESLGEGDHNLSASVTDQAGNESERTPGINITVDTTEVTIAITNVVDDVGTVTGNIARGGVTDDTTPTINGTGKAGSIVKVYDGETLLGSTTIDANGKWSFTPSVPIAPGEHTITANATDAAGQTSEDVSFGFTIDTTAPTMPTIDSAHDDVGAIQGDLASGGVTDDPTPTLSGTAEAGSLVTIYDGEKAIGSVKADADGQWEFTPTSTLSEGSHTFTVTATDAAGNESGRSNAFTLTTDYSAPDASKLAITGVEDNVGEVTGNVSSGESTDDTMPVITGTGTAGDTITVYTTLNGTKIELGSTTVDADGTWKLAITDSNALAAGTHALTAVETDPAGNSTSPTPPYTVTVVTIVPAAPSINTVVDDAGSVTGTLQKGAVTDDSTPTLKGSAGAGLVVRIYDGKTLLGSTVADKDGNWSFTPSTALKDGNHVFTADVVTSVGQSSEKSGEWAISIDTAAPNPVDDLKVIDNVGEVQGEIKDGDTTDDSSPTFEGSAEPGSTVNIYDGDEKIGEVEVGEDGKWSWTPDESLGEGDHSLSVSVTDEAGNESDRTPDINITVDTTEVTIAITNVVDDIGTVTGNIARDGVTDDTMPTINGTGKAGSIVTVYDGTTLLGSTTVDKNGNWSFTPSTALGEGKHTLTANATDAAGQTSEDVSFGFTIDTTAPTMPTIDSAHDDVGAIQGDLASGGVTDDPTPTLSGTAEAGSLVTIYDGEKAIGSVKADADGKWEFTPTSTLSEGSHTFTVTATDAAGNESGRSNAFTLTTDYSAPDASKLAITGVEDNVGEVTGNVASGESTDDTMPVITGTGTAGDTITVYTTLNGTKIELGSTTVDADGTWKLAITDSNALVAGTHALTAVETDPAGNSTSPTPSYTVTVVTIVPAAPSINTVVDDAGSVTGTLQKGAVTDDSTPTLKGSAGAGLVVRIYDGKTLLGSTVADKDGNWTFTPSTALKDGNHVFTADVVTSVGQSSEKSGEWAISIDTAAPNPVDDLKVIDNVGEVQGEIKDGDTTDDSSPTFEGSAEPGSTVNIYDGDEKIGEVEVGEDGKWSWTPDESLGEGDHSLSVSVTDEAGNESDRTPDINITVDTTEVTIAITNVVDDVGTVTGNIARGGVTDDTTPTINGTGKAGSIVKVYDGETLLGSTTIDANGKWSFTPSVPIAPGEHTITANATDAAGQTSEDVSFGFTIDTTAPTMPTIDSAHDDVGAIQGDLASGGVTDDPTPTLSGTAEAGSLVTIYDGEKAIGSVKADADGKWEFTPTSTLSEGSHTFTVTATDAAGNESGRSNAFTLTTDYSAPDASKLAITGVEDNVGEVTGNVASGDSTDDTMPVITGTGTAGDTITVYTTLNGTKIELGSTTVDADGTWKLAITDSNALVAGTHALTAVETDPAGNSTSPTPSYTVTVVTIVPAAPSINTVVDDAGSVTGTLQKGAVTDDSTPTLKGSAGAGLVVRIYDGKTLLGSTVADKDGNWTFTPSTALKDGNHVFTADVVTSVGQSSEKSGEWAISIDTAAPNPVDDLKVIDNVGEVQGEIKDGDTTDDSSPTFEGSAEPGSTVNIYDGDEKIGEVEVGEDGKWSWTPDESLGEGDHSLSVSVTDEAGNESDRTPDINITVDTTEVTIAITNVVDDIGTVTGNIARDGVTDDTMPTINGTGKAGSIVTVYDGTTLLGSTTVDKNGNWSFTPSTALGEGKHTLTANATDAAGQTSEDVSFGFTIDTTAPTMPTIDSAHDDVGAIQGDLASGGVTDDPTPTLGGTAEAGSLVTIYDGEKAIGSVKADADGKWAFTPTSTLSEGSHTFTVTATDAAGNESGRSNAFTLTTDYSAPDASKLAITGVEDNVGEVTGNVSSGESTDDTMPVITGTGTAGDTITVYTTLNGTKIELGSTTVDADGKWSLEIDADHALSSGTHALTAVETDPAGNSTRPSASYTVTVVADVPAAPSINTVVDDAGTVTGTLQKGDVTDDSTPTLNGSSGAGMTIRIYDNNVLIGSTTADSNGNWSFTPTTALKDGSHAFTADAVDGVGQVSDKSGEWAVNIDTQAPDAIKDLTLTDDVGAVTGEIKDGDTTDDATPTFGGSAEPGSTVNIYDGNEKIGSVAVGEDGKWSWTPETELADGDHSLSASVTDKAGNESARTPSVDIKVDTIDVNISISYLVDDVGSVTGNLATGSVTDDVQPEIVGKGKAGSIVKIYDGNILLGSTTVGTDGTWRFTAESDLSEGLHTIKARATDLSGKVSEDATFTITIDTKAPSVPTIDGAYDDVGAIQDNVVNGGVTDDPTPTLSGTAEAGSLVSIYDGTTKVGSVKADANGNWSWTPTTTLSEGSHTFTVTATDAAGNVSGKSNEYTLTTDYTAPDASKLAITGFEDDVGVVTGNIASGGSTDDTMPLISGTGTAGDTITVYTTLNGTKVLLGSTTVDSEGKWSLQVDADHALAAGTHALTAVETDPAGNSTNPSAIYTVTVVGDVPAAPSINTVIDDYGSVTSELQKGAVTDDSTPTLKGSAGAGMTIRIYDNGTLIGSTTADNNGNWAFTPTSNLADGSHAFSADAVNTVGQVSEKSGEWSISIDTAAPSAITDMVITDNVGEVTGPIVNGDTTDDNTPTLSGSAEANSIVTIYDGNTKIGSTTADSNGKWSWTPETILADGKHSLSVSAKDEAGNESDRTAVVDFTIDTANVTISITSVVDDIGSVTGNIAANGVTDDTMPTINGTGKAGSIVKVYDGETLLGSTTVTAGGIWIFTPSTALEDGAHTIKVNATDAAGKTSEDVSFSFTVDTEAPTLPTIDNAEDDVGVIQGPIANNGVTDDPTPTLSGKAEAGSLVTIYDGEKAIGSVKADNNGDWNWTTPTLSAGEHTFTVTATDTAGNVSGKSNEYTLTTDYTAPDGSKLAITGFEDSEGAVTGNIYSGGTSDDKQPVISGTGTAGDTIALYTTLNGEKTLLGTTIVEANGTWKLALDSSNALSEGLNSLSAIESDPAGNATSPSPAYVVTIVPTSFAAPTIDNVDDNAGKTTGTVTSGSSTDDTTPTLSGSAEANSTIFIYNGETKLGQTTSDSNGKWTWTVTPALAEGDYSFSAKAQSSAGVISDASNIWNITVDTTAPNPVADLTITDDVGDYTGPLFDGDITDDNTPTLSGTAEPGSSVTIYNGSSPLDIVTVKEDGSWSWTPGTALKDATYAFSVTVTDAAGNTSAPTPVANITVDTLAPQVTLAINGYHDNTGTNQGLMTGNNGSTDEVNPILTGSWTGDLGATETVRIYQDGVLLGVATVDRTTRTWTYAVKGLENTHKYSFTATAVDAAGNETAISPEFTLTIDLDAPTQTVQIVSYTDDVGLDTGDFPSGTTTDDRNPTLNGTVSGIPLDEGDVVRIYDVVSNTLLGTATVDTATNTWSFVLPPLTDDMSYVYKAVVADAAGNEGTRSDDFHISVNLTINVENQNTLDTTPIISGSTGFDIGEGEYLKVTVNGKTYSSENGQVVIDLRNNTWYVQIPDADAMAADSYDVTAVLYAANGTKITEDDSKNELVIGEQPKISFTATGASSADTSTAITLGENGTWRILSNSAVFTQNGKDSTTLGSFGSVVLSGTAGNTQQQSSFIDMDRDGLMDIMGADTVYWDGQQSFKYDGTTYTGFQVGAVGVAGQTNNPNGNAYVWYGGAAGIDIDGDGYVDIVYGDQTPLDAEARGGYDTTFVMNTDGTIDGYTKGGYFIWDPTSQNGVAATNTYNATPDREIAGVDINNDGYVDIAYHGTAGYNRTSSSGTTNSNDPGRLVIVQNGKDANGNTTLTTSQVINDVFWGDYEIANGYTTMTWADLNGDGFMDLFVGGLSGHGTAQVYGPQSVVFYNDGTGKLTSSANGIGNGSNVQEMGDTTNSMTSLALDWNGDGKMDLVEFAGDVDFRFYGNNANNNLGLLWLNNGVNSGTGQVNWTKQTLLTQANLSLAQSVTGALAVDLDYDGDQDMVVFRGSGGKTEYIENTNTVTDGTSIIVRILDKNGINAYYGNTVLLVDEATGKVVSSQVINAQGGVNMNNSTGLVYFYGLNANSSYSVVLLANGSDVGGVNSVTLNTGANTIENVSTAWSGLKAVEANHAYNLTAESSANASNSSTAASDGTNTVGILGTGYNDTLFATAGTHVYNGGGGSVKVSGVTSWSDTGGMDIVDYKMAGSTALTIDMNNTGYQNTGFGSAKFVNIEGIAGGNGNDTFTGNAANNFFEGRGGNDIFNLNAGGQDTLLYKALSAVNNGGNGQDTVHGFHVGTIEATKNADIINISELLVGYEADSDGAAHYINGVATIDTGDKIKDFLSVIHSGNDTILNIDRDGTGSAYGMTALVTLKDTNVDLETLLANHQITLS